MFQRQVHFASPFHLFHDTLHTLHCFHVSFFHFSILTSPSHFPFAVIGFSLFFFVFLLFLSPQLPLCFTFLSSFPLFAPLSSHIFAFHPPFSLSDPQRCAAGGSCRGLPRVLHGGGAAGVGQTHGSRVLACDWGLHRCGLAPGVQLGGVRRSAGCKKGQRVSLVKGSVDRGFTGRG